MYLLELRNHFRQQIRAAHPGGHNPQRAGARFAELGTTQCCLRQDRFGSQHVVSEKLAGGRQRAGTPSTLDERRAKLAFDVGDVLGNGGLADAQFPSRARERTQPDVRRKCAQSCFEPHNPRLYQKGKLCISVLRSLGRSLKRKQWRSLWSAKAWLC